MLIREEAMLPVLYTLVVLGCDHAVSDCTFVYRASDRWTSRDACERVVRETLEARTGHPFPVLIAKCESELPMVQRPLTSPESRGRRQG